MTSNADSDAAKHAAAALFHAVATSLTTVDNGARLLCLAAAEHLNQTLPPEPPQQPHPGEAIREALRLLASLPTEEFSTEAVLDACAAGRRALIRLG